MNDFFEKLGIEPHDIWVAFALLSRLPIPVDHAHAGERGAKAAWAYPIVGLAIGLIAGLVAAIAQEIGAPRDMSAVVAIAVMVLLTGGMHEDGIADTADSMSGNTFDRKLAIMKDSHIGAFGAIALTLALLARYSGIASISGWYLILALGAVGAVSRAAMVIPMRLLPAARPDGLSASAGKPSERTTLIALGIALVTSILLMGLFNGIEIFLAAIVTAVPVYFYARKTLGGQTGDILGATQQFAEIGALASVAAILMA